MSYQQEPLSEEELRRIEARAAAATPGVWTWADGYVLVDPHCADVTASARNRWFIACAREDVPRLAAEVRRLRMLLEECAHEADRIAQETGEESTARRASALARSCSDAG